MNLRIAKKIYKAIGTDRERAYSPKQITEAVWKYDRMKTTRETAAFADDLLGNRLTIADRAYILRRVPAMALSLLMRTDESDWHKTAGQIMSEGSSGM